MIDKFIRRGRYHVPRVYQIVARITDHEPIIDFDLPYRCGGDLIWTIVYIRDRLRPVQSKKNTKTE